MKKLFFLPLILIISCRNSTPKCDENTTIKNVKEIMFDFWSEAYLVSHIYDNLYDSWNVDDFNERRDGIRNYISLYKRGMYDSIPKNILSLIKTHLDSYSVSNIRTNSSDEVSKSCGCTAQFKNDVIEKEINYSAQRNSEGDIYVEIER